MGELPVAEDGGALEESGTSEGPGASERPRASGRPRASERPRAGERPGVAKGPGVAEGSGVIFVNPRSGRRDLKPERLVGYFPGHRVEQIPAEIRARIDSELAAGAAFVGMAG